MLFSTNLLNTKHLYLSVGMTRPEPGQARVYHSMTGVQDQLSKATTHGVKTTSSLAVSWNILYIGNDCHITTVVYMQHNMNRLGNLYLLFYHQSIVCVECTRTYDRGLPQRDQIIIIILSIYHIKGM